MAVAIVITALACYFLGNHNGAICASAMLHDDVRQHGSGNAGLTNFIRSYGAHSALIVVVIDAGKAVLACLLGGLLLEGYGLKLEGQLLGGACMLLGHDFPALQGFRGGKGILSGLFIAVTVNWRIAVILCAVFFLAYLLTRYVSLGSVLAAIAFGVGFVIFYYDNLWVCLCAIFLSLLTVYMHRGNIARLLRGQERKTDLFAKGRK